MVNIIHKGFQKQSMDFSTHEVKVPVRAVMMMMLQKNIPWFCLIDNLVFILVEVVGWNLEAEVVLSHRGK